MKDIKIIKEEIKNNLSEKRYNHVLMVADVAKSLAQKYNIREEDAYLAGLLHDIAKEMSEKENIQKVKEFNLSSELLQEKYKKIIHADIGAEVAKKLYQINDDIYYAIKYHTIGNKDMNMLAKIIFIADKVGRVELSPELIKIKTLAYENINEALKEYLKLSFIKLASKGVEPHKDTLKLIQTLEE